MYWWAACPVSSASDPHRRSVLPALTRSEARSCREASCTLCQKRSTPSYCLCLNCPWRGVEHMPVQHSNLTIFRNALIIAIAAKGGSSVTEVPPGSNAGMMAAPPMDVEVHRHHCRSQKQQQVRDLHQVQHRHMVLPVPYNHSPIPAHKYRKRCHYEHEAPASSPQPPLMLHASPVNIPIASLQFRPW